MVLVVVVVVVVDATILRYFSLALGQDGCLSRDFGQLPDNLLVSVDEAVEGVRNAGLVAELLDIFLDAAKVVTRHAWEQVVDHLELESAVEKVQPRRAVDIHGGSKHLLWEGFVWPQVGRAHGEVRESDLHVEGACDHVAYHDKDKAIPGGGYGPVEDAITEPDPEENIACDLQMPVPPCDTLPRTTAHEQMVPR